MPPSLASWVFGVLFVTFLIVTFAFAPPALPSYKQRVLALISALLAGLFTYFIPGALGLSIQGERTSLGRLALKGTGGAAAFVLVLLWWSSPLSPVEPSDLIRLRVLPIGPENTPVDDAKVWISVGGEAKKIVGGWEFDISMSNLPPDRKITLYAEQESAFLTGSADVRLSDSLTQSFTIQLTNRRTATVRGIVLDQVGRAVEGAQVSVIGYAGEAVVTSSSGQFLLKAHAADGQQVQLHVEKNGYKPMRQYVLAGAFPAVLTIDTRDDSQD